MINSNIININHLIDKKKDIKIYYSGDKNDMFSLFIDFEINNTRYHMVIYNNKIIFYNKENQKVIKGFNLNLLLEIKQLILCKNNIWQKNCEYEKDDGLCFMDKMIKNYVNNNLL